MAVPKRKHSNSRSGKRRSHDAIRARQLADCQNPRCNARIPTHTICPDCGCYPDKVNAQRQFVELDADD